MAVRYGFYNSLGGDRKYNAMDFSRIFDGVIKDGVFMSIGTSLIVKAAGEMVVNVGIGRAWFNGTWTHNDAILPLRLEACDVLLNRIDAIVLEVNLNDNVRENAIKIVKGEESSKPVKPALSKENNLYQYPLAYIDLVGTANEITQANITNMVGTSECPFVTGILETMDIDALIAQWGTQWDEWTQGVKDDNDQWTTQERADFEAWIAQQKQDMDTWTNTFKTDLNDFTSASESDFENWFNNIKGQLSTDVAGNIQNQIDAATQKEFEHFYGMVSKHTVINKNSEGVTTSIVETTDEAVGTTTFETTETGKTITTVLIPTLGNWDYTKVVTIAVADFGKDINETYTKTPKQAVTE